MGKLVGLNDFSEEMAMSGRRLRFETMEKRQLLAGDLLFPSDVSAPGEVRVVVTGGNMVVTGDIANGVSLNESIQIQQDVENTSNFSVTGLSGTKVNGSAADGTVSFAGVTGSITIDMKGGNNVVKFGESAQQTVNRGLTIRTGVGIDTIEITNTSIRGALLIEAGAGTNNVTLKGVKTGDTVVGTTTIRGTTGDDTVTIEDNGGTTSEFNGTLSVDSGAGINTLTLKSTTVRRGNVSVIGTTGQDTVNITGTTLTNGTLSINSGAGVGTVDLTTVTLRRGNVSVIGTTGDDTVNITGTTLTNGTLSINSGAGVGTVELTTVTLERGNLSVIGTTGNDTVNLTNTTTSNGTLTLDAGAGTNTMNLLGVFASGNATLKGTTGQDTVTIEPVTEGEAVVTQSKFTGALMIDLGTALKNTVTIGSVGPTVVTRDLTIKSPTASEKVSVKNVSVTAGRLSIEAGNVTPNTTAIELESLTINRDLVVVALYPSQDNSDTETMSLKGSTLQGSLSVNAGAGRFNALIQDNEVIAGNATLTAASFGNLTISSSPITGNVTIKSTTGSDKVDISGSQINGRLNVDLGSGANDTFQLSGGNVGKDVAIKTAAAGSSAVEIEGTADAPLQFSGNLTITTANGADDVKVKRTNVIGAVTIVTGAGADDIGLKAVAASADLKIDAGLNPVAVDSNDDGTYELLNLDRIAVVGGSARNVTIDGGDSAASTGPGASQILLTGFNANGNLTITGGNSRDHIGVGDANELDVLATDVGVIDEIIEQLGDDNSGLLGGVTVGGTLTINTFNEQDHVWLHTVTTKSLLIDTSFNLDFVKIYGLTGSGGTGSRLSINLGNGNDTLTLSGVTPTQFASRLIDGGVSSDTLITPSPKIAANDAVFKNWETFESLTPSV
jgi:hypothetical protein